MRKTNPRQASNTRGRQSNGLRPQRKSPQQTNQRRGRQTAQHGTPKLRIIPLGGLEEVGKNMTIFEYGNDIVILDMGLQFPEEDMHGIDYIIPNISYLKGKEKNIRAVIFSHGHLDHIGAAPILLEKLGYPPIAGRPLTIALIRHRQEDYQKGSSKLLKPITVNSIKNTFSFGVFRVSFFQIEHSIMDAVGVILQTPTATIIHPGDWTLEKDTTGNPTIDYSFLSRLKRPTVLMLESLGAIDIRQSATEYQMKQNLEKLIREAPGRVIIGTFASQIERVGWIVSVAEKLGKKVALDGYSMKMNMEIAKKLGYIKAKRDTFIKIDNISSFPDTKLVIIATGAQGEGNAVLSRIITDQHRHVHLKKVDTVVLSSSIIPGNENTIQRLKDNLYRKCDNVIHGQVMDIHVSGHGNRDDIAYVLKKIKPDYFVPVYAYHYMLKEAATLARNIGFNRNNILVLDNGQIAEFSRNGGRATDERVEADNVFVDGLGIGDVGNVVLKDRQVMAEDGMVVAIAKVDKKYKVVGNPDLITRGFIHIKTSDKLMAAMRQVVKKTVEKRLAKDRPKSGDDWGMVKGAIKEDLTKFLLKETQRKPMVLPVVLRV
ncbi:hypothetical protein AUJ42_01875 [Candidatus Collierbacteria bacterium CG1_02_44_10]|uniref:Metallo-beta-lactamase domain-containing protein n=1 Tax=Candidatus Collierbacteria bacterium CG1_02_44_10 TaxID=1805087 RepID=A0A1J4RZX4_9BACT|nr:MAG: hypothetical protein AUJ42_01875 [Candidatus Collierbacteria bacterium CG1_02_44_10]